ncbi:hypothetical protein [Spirosoma linguale]|uniref:Uncharacterized protein n=1 Tax=Spirosoma linguale (strain ATCC 33905 / DSM 74 / LMG 10896 / Claus 1) TaxID=504472 RepID=D2QNM8_SPILD|nr:hypothetical protein Slin_4585 [Spirosoma linguale DSM 74]
MTPDKRLDQIEPILADVALKTDRLIESNGQILEIATRADANATIAAKGIADLTIEMRQQFGHQQHQIDQLKTEMNERFGHVDEQFSQMNNRFGQIDERFEQMNERFGQQQAQIDLLRTEMNHKFAQVTQTQEQILTLLLDRLK